MHSRLGSVIGAVAVALWVGVAHGQFQLQPAFPNLSFASPVDVQHAGDGSNRLFVVEQVGRIRVFDNTPAVATAPVFLDMTSRVTNGGERGLLGLAFDPHFSGNGYFYVSYTAANPLRSIIARYEVDAAQPNQGDPNSERILLEVAQPAGNHNAGQLAFGPEDGYLYIALGDGGGSGDPGENGQNPETLLGAILRIDVGGVPAQSTGRIAAPDCGAGPNAVYNIPADNPLVDGPGNTCDEIWAYGLRNPWRFSFDPITKQLWTADVGQGDYEEVDLITPGGNYGWNTMEGAHCFDPPAGCDPTGLIPPVWEYPHNGQSKSVTGGYVYRGAAVPELYGRYVYADFIDGRIWALAYDGQQAVNTLLLNTNLSISTFGVDEQGELYVVDHGGALHRFAPTLAFGITLKKLLRTATGTKKARIKWDPGTVSKNKMDIYVDEAPDGSPLKRTRNDGADKVKLKTALFPGDGPFFLQACEKNSTMACSNIVAADFTGVALDLSEPEDEGEDDEEAGTRVAASMHVEVYPNPFNPATTIRFTLPEAEVVQLAVFDVLGRRVAVLVEGLVAAGTHEIAYEAETVPGGVYFYRIQAGSQGVTGRMTLLR